MYAPFPGNYVWNLSTNITLNCGGNIGEVDVACRPVRDAASRGEDAGTAQFFDSWVKVDRIPLSIPSNRKIGFPEKRGPS